MPMNEESTRYHLIDPVLREKGYNRIEFITCETPAPVEPTGDKGRRRKGGGRTDYLLSVPIPSKPQPLIVGVIEAKAESEDPLKGMQQARRYSDCTRFAVRYAFSTNGHRYGEFDLGAQRLAGPLPFPDFPGHAALTSRYLADAGLAPQADTTLLCMADSAAYSKPRYYQDAAIRAAFEKILRCEQAGEAAHVLLSLATGSGKTVIAANLLWRLHEAGRLAKPALFLCDRDELREQALSKLRPVFGDAVRIVRTERGENAARNARVHVATYQTLGLDDEGDASFLTQHYGEDAFSVIVIDECHRSAWGRWSQVLTRNPYAIQIGLTATPRRLEAPKKPRAAPSEDDAITAHNVKYFGEPVYEYGLIQAQEDGYLAACEVVRLRPNIDDKTFTREDVLAMQPVDSCTGAPLTPEQIKDQYAASSFDDELMLPKRIQAMCADLFERLCRHGGPEQKVIIFCTRDAHADRVAMAMQNLYADWCKRNFKAPKDKYAFKCTAEGGSELIEQMRGSGERCFIACTVDLLATGVDIERLNAVVFFRYLESAITFYQMVGRGTRIDEPTRKYKFWLYDYTGVTRLFGTEFLSKPRKPRERPLGCGHGPTPPPPPPLPEAQCGDPVQMVNEQRFILQYRDGQEELVPLDDYRRGMIERVLAEASNLQDFRALWIEHKTRRALLAHLLGERYDPDTVRELLDMTAFDHYDMFAHFGYRELALTRHGREAAYLAQHAAWFAQADGRAAIVLRALGLQFGAGGTEALDSPELWQVPEIARAGGIAALRKLGAPGEVLREAKLRLFGV
jgi:type I restriction enzyme R subunit